MAACSQSSGAGIYSWKDHDLCWNKGESKYHLLPTLHAQSVTQVNGDALYKLIDLDAYKSISTMQFTPFHQCLEILDKEQVAYQIVPTFEHGDG